MRVGQQSRRHAEIAEQEEEQADPEARGEEEMVEEKPDQCDSRHA